MPTSADLFLSHLLDRMLAVGNLHVMSASAEACLLLAGFCHIS